MHLMKTLYTFRVIINLFRILKNYSVTVYI